MNGKPFYGAKASEVCRLKTSRLLHAFRRRTIFFCLNASNCHYALVEYACTPSMTLVDRLKVSGCATRHKSSQVQFLHSSATTFGHHSGRRHGAFCVIYRKHNHFHSPTANVPNNDLARRFPFTLPPALPTHGDETGGGSGLDFPCVSQNPGNLPEA